MNDKIKIALIAAVTLISAVGLNIYFSPYNTCVRGLKSGGNSEIEANWQCAMKLGNSAH
jgi:hypothetical protein